MRLLLVNPNTSAPVTELCAGEARRVAGPGTEVVPLTGAFGPRIISTRAENTIAAHAMLDALAANAEGADAVLLAVSFDTALQAARELLSVPVVGMTEAALVTSLLLGSRTGLVTFGAIGMYRELVAEHGMQGRVAGIEAVQADAIAAYSDPARVEELVLEAAMRLVDREGVASVVLCGAAMAGMAVRLGGRSTVPLLDGISCGVMLCEGLVRLGIRPSRTGGPVGRDSTGLSAPLAAMLARRP